MNKRGQSAHYTWMELVLGAIGAAMLFAIAFRMGNPHAMNQEFIAKDSALIIDELYGVPRDSSAGIMYPHKFEQYRFETRDSLVLVSDARSSELSAKPHYPYAPHTDYMPLSEDFLFVSLDFLRDRTGVHFSSTTNVLAGTIKVDDVFTADALIAKKIFITGKEDAKRIISLLQAIINVESERGADENSADMIIFISTNEENILRIYTADEDLINARKSKKLGQIMYNEFLKVDFSSRELKIPVTHIGDYSIFRNHMPTVLVEVGNGKLEGSAYANAIIVAVREYYR